MIVCKYRNLSIRRVQDSISFSLPIIPIIRPTIYDCTVRPVEGDEIGTALIAHYHYTEYDEKFDEIYSVLSKESALSGEFQRVFSNIRGAMRREPFDAYFLDQIRGWRMQLGKDVEFIVDWAIRTTTDTILEPSCGDGSFVNEQVSKIR